MLIQQKDISPVFARNKIIRILLFFILGIPSVSQGQQFGGNPTSTKWMQINSDTLRVIFPKGHKRQAWQVFNTSQYMLRNERASIGHRTQQFNIILQPQTALSNGFVTLGPFRSIFLTTPSQDVFSLGTTNWLSQLSIHETWHALQYMNFKTGLARTFHTLFGEKGQSFIDNYFIPDWYWEGEAVFMETQLTRQGRGRLPSFLDTYKAMWLTNTHYNYGKIRNGSLKDLVPNRYQSGYITVAYGRNKYGNNFWRSIMQKALLNKKTIKRNNKRHSDRPFHLFQYGFYPLDAALHYRTGKKIKPFYQSSISYFKKKWKHQYLSSTYTPVDTITRRKGKSVLNYEHPTVLPDSSVLAFKSGNAQLPEIVKIDSSGKEKTILPIGNTLQHYYSYGDHKIVWTSYRPDMRWGWKSYADIQLYNIKTRTRKTLTHRGSYFSPSLSHDGNRIIAVKTFDSRDKLVLFDANTGDKMKVIPNPHGFFYTYPVFGKNNHLLFVGARDSVNNTALIRINIRTGDQDTLTPFIPKAIGPASVKNKYIYFPAGFGNNIQIYALRKKDQKIFQVANRPIGDYSVAIDTASGKLIFSEYSLDGFQLLSTPKKVTEWEPVDNTILHKVHHPFVKNALTLHQDSSILQDIPHKERNTKRYYPYKHLFNVRSWSFESLYPKTSVFLQSRDLMGKMLAKAGVGYNFNENTPFLQAEMNYGGLFPYINVGIKRIFNRTGLTTDSTAVKWDETNWFAGINIPLNLSSHLYHRYLSVSGTFHQGILQFKKINSTKKPRNRVINYYTLGMTFNTLRNEAVQHINPKLGIAGNMKYYHTLGTAPINQLNANLNFFLPGLFPNHSLYFTTSFSTKKSNNIYKFEDIFHYARGYSSIPYQQIYTLGVNYQLPLCYPDIGLPWLYLSRIRLHLFFDYSRVNLPAAFSKPHDTFRSAGANLYFDTKIFKTAIPIGLQYVYLLDRDPKGNKAIQLSLNFPMNLFFQ